MYVLQSSMCHSAQRKRRNFRELRYSEVRRIPLPRPPVNNAKSSDRLSQDPKGRTHRAGEWHKKEALPSHSQNALIGAMGGSSPQAGEFLLKERVVLRAFLLAFQPLHVALNPRVVALGHKARERFRGNEVHKSLLGAIPKYARLPLLGLLMAMLTLCQIPKLSACFCI